MEPLPTKKGYLPIGRYPIHIVLWFQICFIEKGRAEKFIDANFKSLAHFVDDPEFHRWIGAVDDIGYGGTGKTAFGRKLILRHVLFGKQLLKPHADSLIQLHIITTMSM